MDKLPEGFNEFWSIFPRKVAKQAAIRMYARALKTTTPKIIATTARKYAQERAGKDVQFTKHPATWLNGERWEDFQMDEQTERIPNINPVRILVDTPQWDQWQAYLKAKTGRVTPCVNFGWYFPSEWPPGHEGQTRKEEADHAIR